MKIHFLSTLKQIIDSDAQLPVVSLGNYIKWLYIRFTKKTPITLPFSESVIVSDQLGGVAALIIIFGLYDTNNMNLLRVLLSSFPELSFIDVGANIGTYTILATETNAHVIAIEAHPRTYAQLQRNITINKRNNVTSINVAISDHDGMVRFTDLKENAINRIDDNGDLIVPCSSLDSIIEKNCNATFIVKIDVEGNESKVIGSLEENFGQVSIFFIENGNIPQIKQKMMRNGYLGPFYCHWNLKKLKTVPQKRLEDVIYISKDSIFRLHEIGVTCDPDIVFMSKLD